MSFYLFIRNCTYANFSEQRPSDGAFSGAPNLGFLLAWSLPRVCSRPTLAKGLGGVLGRLLTLFMSQHATAEVTDTLRAAYENW